MYGTTQDVEVNSNGMVRLAATASEAPQTYGSFQRFGLYDSTSTSFARSFNQLRVTYRRTMPAATRARVDVRASADRVRWSEWQLDVASGSTVRFDAPMKWSQYRVVLLSNTAQSPTISKVSFEPQMTRGFKTRQTEAPQIAPTYRLRVTRQGMVGGRTANGHIIKPNDFFVSLPSGRALSSRGGYEYQVRLSANGKSVVVPVWDNGPWNHHDDFWNKNRERYKDLPVGWPQDHAAYYENHNSRKAERGYVRFPTAVDIGDGAYWALGLAGAQATVDVTFLWLGSDPGPSPMPLNSRPSERPRLDEPEVIAASPEPAPTLPPTPTAPPEPDTIVNDLDKAFFSQGEHWNMVSGACAYGGQAHQTKTVVGSEQATHQVVWRPALRGGTYDVYAFIPPCPTTGALTTRATYIVHHAQGDSYVPIDQTATFGTWALLGRFSFAPGGDGYVQLRNTDAKGQALMIFDAVKWTPVTP
ncbi:MAG TPA: hypothetical protein VFZ66_01770 [Herpetosiphonaceae bacterium]